jgi:hypothetical protein
MSDLSKEPQRARGADIEIIDRYSGDEPPMIVPNGVRINGVEVLVPKDAPIQVGEISSDQIVTVTLTLVARHLVIRHEQP